MSTPAIWCRIVRSRDFHPCDLVPRCPFSRCQSPQIRSSRDVMSRDFSRPLLWCHTVQQWRIQKSGIGGGRVGDGVWYSPLPRKFVKFLCKNSAFFCKIFACFKMHPVNRGAARPPLLLPLLLLNVLTFERLHFECCGLCRTLMLDKTLLSCIAMTFWQYILAFFGMMIFARRKSTYNLRHFRNL